MVLHYFGIPTPCSLNLILIHMHLAPGVVEVTGAYIGFSSNGLIIFAASQSLLKNLYYYWWQWQYLAME